MTLLRIGIIQRLFIILLKMRILESMKGSKGFAPQGKKREVSERNEYNPKLLLFLFFYTIQRFTFF